MASQAYRFQGRPFKCSACDIWFSNYDLWISHLTTEAHQGQVTSRPGNYHSHEYWREESIKDKCVIVSGVKNVGISELMFYLSRWGVVVDIIRQERKTSGPVDFYYVQYETEYVVLLKIF